ncbi:MAG TPA: YfcE family phosphodiesterase [Tepidisphaeraceae bacterium]|nr:YfcE family phosphodiesterase [Tepidisphaeraceae bacterium]
MRIGILSDTHDAADKAAAAIALLRAGGAKFFIHCGDVGGQRVLDQFAGLPAALVWGNNDFDRATLARYGKRLGIDCHDRLAELELGGKKFAVMHGDDGGLFQLILAQQRHDYLLFGHSHELHDSREGRIRLINPGALYRARRKTAVVLETQTDALEVVDVG